MYTSTRKPKARAATTKGKGRKSKAGFSIGKASFMGIKTPEVKAYWKSRGRSQPSSVVPRYLSGGGRASAFMSRNTAYGPTSYNAGAIAMGNDDGIVRIKHREFIGVINSSTAFTTQRYEINPGLKIYPWISSIANSFQQYRVNNMGWSNSQSTIKVSQF